MPRVAGSHSVSVVEVYSPPAAALLAVAGVFAKLAAPVVSGAIAVVAAVLPLLVVVLRGVPNWVPNWVPLSSAGLLLLLAGAMFEARMRDVRRLRGWLAGLH